MAKQLQLRKGTATEHNTFTGANGEVTVDTTNKTLRVHDGSTVGGIRLATIQGAVILNNTLTSTSTTEALTAAQGKVLNDQTFGVGQTWQDVTASRALGTTYTNSTGKPIQVSVVVRDNSTHNLYFFVNGASVVSLPDMDGGSSGFQQLIITVPPTQTYRLETSNLLSSWWELR